MRRARKLPDTEGRKGWYETLPAPVEALRVRGKVRSDWAVIGDGTIKRAAA